MKIVIVVPTYNEIENVRRLVPVLADEFKKINHNCHVLVVDGNSPDGTGDLVKSFEKTYPFVHLLLEKKKAGLGAAYAYGFKHAIKEMSAEALIEMDADFQHDPKDIKRLLDEIDNGYDYVIGSRFVKGGSIPQEWALYRKLFSWGGSFVSKLVLGIFNVKDFTTGYKASRVRGFADKLDLDNIISKGFAYKIELLYRMHKLGARIKEIPIEFGLRDRGTSKMESNNLTDSLKVVFTIRYNENKNFFKFLVVGSIGFAVDSILANILRLGPLTSTLASLVSGFIAMVTTYLLNNFWSFSDRKQVSGTAKRLVGFAVYVVSSYLPIIFRSWLISWTVRTFEDNFIIFNVAFVVGVIIGLIWNFTVYSRLIWRNKK
ncbi:MAG: glycosyltransferase family 2 protein [Patescibacteria group bacterium]|jgi:dolichol-phosphate mannosyltransferase